MRHRRRGLQTPGTDERGPAQTPARADLLPCPPCGPATPAETPAARPGRVSWEDMDLTTTRIRVLLSPTDLGPVSDYAAASGAALVANSRMATAGGGERGL